MLIKSGFKIYLANTLKNLVTQINIIIKIDCLQKGLKVQSENLLETSKYLLNFEFRAFLTVVTIYMIQRKRTFLQRFW